VLLADLGEVRDSLSPEVLQCCSQIGPQNISLVFWFTHRIYTDHALHLTDLKGNRPVTNGVVENVFD
jgi:hypothetical protein